MMVARSDGESPSQSACRVGVALCGGGLEDVREVVCTKHRLPAEQLIEDAAHREDVGADVDVLRAAPLLRGHVARGAHRGLGAGQLGAVLGEHLGDAEVGDPGDRGAVDLRDEDVGGL